MAEHLQQSADRAVVASVQGAHDGFCGIYAVINALRLSGGLGESGERNDAQHVFVECCKALPMRCWPRVAWDGIHQADMARMIACVASEIPGFPLVVTPFASRRFNSHDDFWVELNRNLKGGNVACAIAWLRHPIDHWLVVQSSRNGLRIIDSDPDRLTSTYTWSAHQISSGAKVVDPSLRYLDRRAVMLFLRS